MSKKTVTAPESVPAITKKTERALAFIGNLSAQDRKTMTWVVADREERAVVRFIAMLSTTTLIVIAHFAKPLYGAEGVPLKCGDGKLNKVVVEELAKRDLMKRKNKHLYWNVSEDGKEVLFERFFLDPDKSLEEEFFTEVVGSKTYPWKEMWERMAVEDHEKITVEVAHERVLARMKTNAVKVIDGNHRLSTRKRTSKA